MKIGVVSDTHSKEVPQKLLDSLKDVDLIIHAGDLCDLSVLKRFQDIKETKAVYGNMDDSEVRKALPRRQIIKVKPYTIGLFHGEGAPKHLLQVVQKEFDGERVDVVIFGHSHSPFNEKIDGVLYFNPGSPNDDMFAPYASYGVLEITGEEISGRIIKLKE